MNRFLEAAGVTYYERRLVAALHGDSPATTGAELLTALRAYDQTLQDDRLKQVLSNVTQTCSLNPARAVIVTEALGSLS